MNKQTLKEEIDLKVVEGQAEAELPANISASVDSNCSYATPLPDGSAGYSLPSQGSNSKGGQGFFWKSAMLPWLCSIYLGFTGYFVAHLGFDWGYYFVKHFFGQQHGVNQGVMAIVILYFLIVPMCMAMGLACFDRVRKHPFAHSLPLLGLLMISQLVVLGTSSSGWDLPSYLVSTLVSFAMSFKVSSFFIEQLKGRILLKPLYKSCLLSFSAIGVASMMFTGSVGTLRELMLFGFGLFCASFMASSLAKVKNKTAAVATPVFALAPLVMANVINVLVTSVSLILDQFKIGFELGWEALASACIISLATFAAAAAGGMLGFEWNKRATH